MMIFNTIELTGFVMMLIAFVILAENSFKIKKKSGLKWVFVFAFLFALFGRLSVNLELLFWKDVFGFLEYFFQFLAAVLLAYAGYSGGKNDRV